MLNFFIGIAVSILFLWLAFRKVDIPILISSFQTVRPLFVGIAVLIQIGSYLIIAWRWQKILKPVEEIDYSFVYHTTVIGFMSNSLLPARLGELIKTFLLGESQGISKSSVLATVFLERMFDLVVILFFFLVLKLFYPLPGILEKVGRISIVLIILVLLFIILVRYKPGFFEFIINKFPLGFAKKLQGWFYAFREGLSLIHSGKGISLIFLQTVLLWGYISIVLWVLFYGFGLHLPFYACLVLMVAITFGVMIPSSPGFVGTYHFFCSEVLTLFGISKEVSLSYAVVSHIVIFFPVVILGLLSLSRLNLSFRQIISFRKH